MGRISLSTIIIGGFLLSLSVVVVLGIPSISDDPLISSWMNGEESRGESKLGDTFVTIKNGKIKGQTYKAMGGDTIYAYLGIPYAKSPVGPLRFEPPQAYDENWGDKVWDGSKQPNACTQWLTNTTMAAEDCLFVSVYTKRGEDNPGDGTLKPVMYWIHGGAFFLGQTSYYPSSKLLAQDVVYVSVQYRLGPLGFLTTGDSVVPGNNGLKDIVQGLKWVKENIAAFGGDPDKVTVFGESAGAAAATYMIISPMAQGLYHRVAAMSGTAIAEWSIERDGKRSGTKLAEALNCPVTDSQAMVDCLKALPWETISKKHLFMLLTEQATALKAILSGTSPVVEPNLPGAFLPDEPLALLERGTLPDVPVLMGAVQNEGSFLLGVAHLLRFAVSHELEDSTYVHDHLIGDLLATWGVDESLNGASISQALSLAFIPPGPRTQFSEITYGLMDMISSLFMKAPILRTAEILSRRMPTAPVYFYSFEYPGRNSLWNFIPLITGIFGLGDLAPPYEGGITHGDDLIYMFNMPFLPSMKDAEFSKIYCEFFTNFATFGSPAPVTDPEGRYPMWPAFKIEDPNYMVLTSPPVVKQDYTQSWRQGILPKI